MKHKSFLDLPVTGHRGGISPYAILPVPYERTSSYRKGSCHGPEAVLEASAQVDEYDDELRIPLDIHLETLPALEFEGLSDPAARNAIESAARAVLRDDRFLLSIGGEHGITPPLVQAARDECRVETVIQLDAHADLRDAYEGNPHSHACVMRRVQDMGLSTVQIGIRSLSRVEADLIDSGGSVVLWARDLVDSPIDPAQVDPHVRGRVYLTIDIDVLDPAVAPGTGTPEPGGLSWYAVMAIIRHIVSTHDVVAADIVEVAPIDGSVVTEFVAARLAAKLLMYHQQRRREA